MSIQLVLSHYLAGLRERNELDALLPDLLRAMGHSVLSRPQQGVYQAGVDVVSTNEEADGSTVVYLFVVKFGNIGRDGFFVGKQSVDASVRETSGAYIRSRLPDGLNDAKKVIVVVSNGVLSQEAGEGFAGLSKDIGERPRQELAFWGMDQLTPLIEKHIFDESLLLDKGKSDLRAALASLEQSEVSVERFVRFVDTCMLTPEGETAGSETTRRKNFLRRCSAAAMGWAVLLGWCETEKNLKPGVVSGEYLLLRLWADAVRAGLEGNSSVQDRLANLVHLQTGALLRYYQKLAPHLLSRREVLAYRRELVFYADAIFEELGRLGLTLLLLQHMEDTDELRQHVRSLLIRFVNEHSGCRLPVLDGQAIDLSLALLGLIGERDTTSANNLLALAVQYLSVAVRHGHWLPVDTDLIEDAIAVQEGEADPLEYFRTSTLFPMLGMFAALLNDEAALQELNNVVPGLGDVNLERWYPRLELETLTGSAQRVTDVGISRSIERLQHEAQAELAATRKLPIDAAAYEEFKWATTPFEVLAAVSARLHRHPLPVWYVEMHSARRMATDVPEVAVPGES